jgi:transcriptional regulator with XRE-family HTH domain
MSSVKTVSEWMAENGVGLEELLGASGLEQKVLEAILQGRYTPSPQQRRRVAEALGVPVEEIAWGHTTPVSHLYGHGPQFGRTP